jgi:hypothetical protein
MPDTLFQGHIDVFLSTYAQQFRNLMFLGDTLFPRVPSGRQADKYAIFGREHMQMDGVDTRAPGAAARQIVQSLADAPFHCPDHSLAWIIHDEEVPATQLPTMQDPRQRKTRVAEEGLLLNHDIRVAALMATAANYPTGNKVQLSSTDQWDESLEAASNPQEDVETAKLAILTKMGVMPNTMVLGPLVAKALKFHAKLLAKVDPNKVGTVTLDDLKAVFEIPNIYVWNTLKRSALGVNSFVFPNHAWVGYIQPGASVEDLTFGKTFEWVMAPGSVGGHRVEVGRAGMPSQLAEEGSNHWWHDEKIVAPEAGYLIEDAVDAP